VSLVRLLDRCSIVAHTTDLAITDADRKDLYACTKSVDCCSWESAYDFYCSYDQREETFVRDMNIPDRACT
jgi:hypothetical protein